MVAIKALAVLALAGTLSAAPTQTVGEALERRWNWGRGRPQSNYNSGNWNWRWGQGSSDSSSSSTPTAAAQPAASTPDTTVSTPAPAAAAAQPAAAAASSAAPVASSSDSSSSGGYMGIVNEWRGKMGLPSLTESSKLQGNAQKTSDDSGGQLKHELNDGSMAQVLAPGNSGNFESVFVGGWLCEMPSLPGLGSSVCDKMSQGWDHGGQTGHAEILSSTTYTNIGCALGDGIWACDLS